MVIMHVCVCTYVCVDLFTEPSFLSTTNFNRFSAYEPVELDLIEQRKTLRTSTFVGIIRVLQFLVGPVYQAFTSR